MNTRADLPLGEVIPKRVAVSVDDYREEVPDRVGARRHGRENQSLVLDLLSVDIGNLTSTPRELGQARYQSVIQDGSLDFIQLFCKTRSKLEGEFPRLKSALDVNGMLWISWPKRSSGVETDLSGNVVREIGLAHGLVDVKVAAVDETWSGLKFVYRLRDRRT